MYSLKYFGWVLLFLFFFLNQNLWHKLQIENLTLNSPPSPDFNWNSREESPNSSRVEAEPFQSPYYYVLLFIKHIHTCMYLINSGTYMCYIYYVNSETHIYIYTYIYIQIHKYTHLFIVNTEIRLFCNIQIITYQWLCKTQRSYTQCSQKKTIAICSIMIQKQRKNVQNCYYLLNPTLNLRFRYELGLYASLPPGLNNQHDLEDTLSQNRITSSSVWQFL